MHPEISLLPSRVFYQGKLLDGPDMDMKTTQPWHLQEKFGPYKFFNVAGQEESNHSHSLVNKAECQMAVALYAHLCKEFSSSDFDFRVGVISMYRAQIGELKRAFIQRFGSDIVGKILFHTVDGFQGQEKDVIILSCVRAGPGLQNIGFLAGKCVGYDRISACSEALPRCKTDECCSHTCEVLPLYPRKRADFREK